MAFLTASAKSEAGEPIMRSRIRRLLDLRSWPRRRKEYKIVKTAFDSVFYLETYPDAAKWPFDAITHYLAIGQYEGRKPREDFDPFFYLSEYPDVKNAGVNPFVHYIVSGRSEGRLPFKLSVDPNEYAIVSKEFDLVFYRQTYPEANSDLDPVANYLERDWKKGKRPQGSFDPLFYFSYYDDVAASGLNPFTHYIVCGRERGRYASFEDVATVATVEKRIKDGGIEPIATAHEAGEDAIVQRIDPSLLFDAAWYLARYPDVQMAGVKPFSHYWGIGASEGRDPHPLFDSRYYLSQFDHAEREIANPLEHYIRTGAALGLSPHPLFDRHYYRAGNPDIAKVGVDEFYHFVTAGDKEGRSTHPLFDPLFYLRNNPDVAAAGAGFLRHFVAIGGAEGRNPHPMFDCQYYFWLHPDVFEQRQNPLIHYLQQRREARRHPHPLFDGQAQMRTSALAHESAIDPLMDYVQFRSHLDPHLVARHATYIPTPARATLSMRDTAANPTAVVSPLVSILMPAYNSQERYFVAAVNSVRAQTYENWELIIVNDGSPEPHVAPMIERCAASDPRIRTRQLAKNAGISRATNEALQLAKGEYVALIDHDDVLLSNALEVMVQALLEQEGDAAYSDQAYVSAWNTFESTFYKPDWSPTMFTGVMYVGHLLVVRRSLALAVEGFDQKFDRLQDYEFMLRVSERTKRIIHISQMLYHWRKIPGSIAHDASSKGAIEPMQATAVNAHFDRIGFPAVAEPHENLPHRLAIVPKPRKAYPEIDVLLRGDRPIEYVERLMGMLTSQGGRFSHIEVVGTNVEATHTLADETPEVDRSAPRVKPSVFSRIVQALSTSQSRFVLFVDPLAEITEERWLDYLLLYAEREDTAFVAPHLYRRDGCVAAAGFIIGSSGLLPAMQGMRLGEDGYAGSLCCTREVSALPTSMILADRNALAAIGGLDSDFSTPLYGFGDASVRAIARGYRNIALATPILEVEDDYPTAEPEAARDTILFRDVHAAAISRGDPFYNVNFPPNSANYST